MNIKKLFATLAGVSLFAQTVVPSAGVFGATYSEELQDAYNWAYGKSITTMSSIDNANMYGAITRAELAKMLANWAKDAGKTPDTSVACNFTDTASVQGDLATAIVEACQLGLMGQGISAFRPYDTISRAEFGTALSRALYGNQYEGGTPYYAKHLDALKAAGIMNQIANAESTKEVRGYVMLMLMRSEDAAPLVDCEDADVVLACMSDLDNCPAACKADYEEEDEDVVVKAGDLVVKSSAADDRVVVVSTTTDAVSDLDTLTFKTSEEVTITKVVLEKYGYADNNLVKSVWLEDEDGNEITSPSTINSKGLVNLTVKKDYKVVDGTLNATIVVKTDHTQDAKGTLGFKVNDVKSTAANLDLGNYKAYTYDVVAYNGSTATVTARGGSKDYNYEAGKAYEIAKFKVKAPESSAISVKSFVLKNNGAAATLDIYDFLDADSIEVTVAGKTVKATASVNKDKELTVSFKDSVEINSKQNVEVIVSAELNSDFDEYNKVIEFTMTSISATDKNNARISISTTGADFVAYKFLGGKVKFTSNKLGGIEAAINSDDVLIADGTIEVTEELEGSATITITQAAPYPVNVIKEIRLVIAGEETVGTITDKNTTTATATFSNLDISESGKVRVYVDIDDLSAYEGKSMTFSSINWNLKYEEDNSISADTAGSVSVSKLTLTKPEGSLTNSISSDEVEFKNGSSETKEIFKGTYTAKKNAINLNKFTLTGDWAKVGGAYEGENAMHVYLYVDGTEVADAKLNCNATTCTATDTFTDVLVEANKSVEVSVEAEVNGTMARPAIKFNLVLEGTDENDNDAGEARKQTAKVSVVDQGTPDIETSTSKSTILLRGSDAAIAEFIVKPSGSSSIDLEKVAFLAAGVNNDCGNIRLTVGNVDKTFEKVSTQCVVADFEEEIDTNGKTLKIEFDVEPEQSTSLILANINGLELNGKPFTNKTFNKAYADAVISFNQENRTDKTRFTVASIEKYNSATTISNLRFYNEKNQELVMNGITPDTELSVGDSFTIANLKSSVYVKKIAYTVKRTNFTQNVVVDYNTYKDFFKTNDDDLGTYAYGDAADSVSNTKDLIAAYVSSDVYGKATSNLQSNVVVDNANRKITGTLKKVTTYPSAGFDMAQGTHFLALEAVNSDVTQININAGGELSSSERFVVLQINSGKLSQKLKVYLNGSVVEYDISELVLQD